MSDDIISLEALALSLVSGGHASRAVRQLRDEANQVLSQPSGEGNLTCEEALSAHCSQVCAQGARGILEKLRKVK